MKGVQAIHGLLLLSLLSLPLFFGVLQSWPFYLLVPLTIYVVIVLATSPLRNSICWLRLGRFSLEVQLLTLTASVLAPVGLIWWYTQYRYSSDLSGLGSQVPNWSLPWLILGGVGFSVGNALLEEIVFRGVLFEALAEGFGALPAMIAQGVAFGIVHAHGFPRGVVGVLLASVYGISLGLLRLRSGGLLAPFIAHVVSTSTTCNTPKTPCFCGSGGSTHLSSCRGQAVARPWLPARE
jgi:CAAX protease family protein